MEGCGGGDRSKGGDQQSGAEQASPSRRRRRSKERPGEQGEADEEAREVGRGGEGERRGYADWLAGEEPIARMGDEGQRGQGDDGDREQRELDDAGRTSTGLGRYLTSPFCLSQAEAVAFTSSPSTAILAFRVRSVAPSSAAKAGASRPGMAG